jgi:hypothetical protein
VRAPHTSVHLQIDPKVAFPKRQQPKVCTTATAAGNRRRTRTAVLQRVGGLHNVSS